MPASIGRREQAANRNGDHLWGDVGTRWTIDHSLDECHSIDGVPSDIDRLPRCEFLLVASRIHHSNRPNYLIGEPEPVVHVASIVDGLVDASGDDIVALEFGGLPGQMYSLGPYHQRDRGSGCERRLAPHHDGRQTRDLHPTFGSINRLDAPDELVGLAHKVGYKQ